MSGFSELIKNFEKTRDYLRDFFIYGYKVRGDFDRKSARTYDDEKRRIESWLDGCLKYETSQRGRQTSISVDSGRISENPLYKAFYAKSFTDNDIKLHFLLLDILSDFDSLTLKELIEKTDERFGILFEEQTVRNKLKEYAAEGIIIAEKRGKTACFSLCPDRVSNYLNELPGLSDAIKFYSAAGVLGVVGDSILKAADMENDLFFIKHNYIVHTLEDSLLPEIISAIEQKRFLALRTFSSRNGFSKENENFAVPMQVSISVQTGRRYLIAFIPQYKRFNSFRLDSLRAVKPGEICPDYDKIREKYDKNITRCFGASFGERRETGNVTPLKVTFTADENTEPHIIQRLLREKRCGKLTKLSENLYELEIDVFDPVEPMHWIKTFIGRITKLEGGSESARRMFFNDIKRMNEMYNGDNDEHIQ